MTVKDKVVVITGASSGIGAATTQVLAQAGAKLVIGARREDRLAKLAEPFGNDQIRYQATDVTNQDQVKSLVDLAIKTFGHVDVLFNNAGLMPLSEMAELKVNEWERMVNGTVAKSLRLILWPVISSIPELLFIPALNGQFRQLWTVCVRNKQRTTLNQP